MSFIIYVSNNRNDASGASTLATGHSDATSYTIDFNPRVLERTPSNDTSYQSALDGSRESIHLSHGEIWQVETSIITKDSSTWESWLEFLHSVRGGETFQWNPYGSSTDSPNGAYNVMLSNPAWSINRATDFVDKFTFGFTVLSNENL